MPVEFEEYDPNQGRLDLTPGTNAHDILAFLASHPDLGFTPKEIHTATDIPRGSVGTTLERLREHGLVRHRGDYWAVVPDDRLLAVEGISLSMDAVADQFGDDWYARNPDWAEDLPDLDAADEEEGET